MAKTAIFLAEGFEEIEALTVVDLLRRAQIDITMVSVMGDQYVTGSHGIVVKADVLIGDYNFEEADMLILPGGMPGTTNLGECTTLTDQLLKFNQAERPLAAICAAPTVLGKLGILEGKKASCYPGCERDLKGALPQTDEVTVCDHITTSRGMGTAIPFGLAIIEHFQGPDAAKEMAQKIVYRQ
jgi:4-methyl-5(b-hydroxyethyl)-thiazole monophosphate biosynthesis